MTIILIGLKIIFICNWRIMALQYYVGFYQISTWISHRFTHVINRFLSVSLSLSSWNKLDHDNLNGLASADFKSPKSAVWSSKQCHPALGSDSRVGKISWKRKWQPIPVCLENSMDRGAWWAPQSMESQRVGHNWATFTHSYSQVADVHRHIVCIIKLIKFANTLCRI